jgi:hypothetical protein
MDATSLLTNSLTSTAIDALKKAYQESTSDQAKQSIAAAYTSIVLLKNVFVKSETCNDRLDSLDSDDSYDPSEYCAAI